MASNRKRNDIIMNPNATYTQPGIISGQSGANMTQSTDPQRLSPVQEALGVLFNSIGAAQKTQETLERQLASACNCYPVNPFASALQEGMESSGCMLVDQIMAIVRMTNSLVDRQEAMSRNIQL